MSAEESLQKIEGLLRTVLREQGNSSMFADPVLARKGDGMKDQSERENEALLKTLRDIEKGDMQNQKRFYKEMEKNIRESGVKTIKSIETAADVFKAQDQSDALKILAGKLEDAKKIKFKNKEEADAHFENLSDIAKKTGINLDDFGVKVTTFAKAVKGGAIEVTHGYNNVDKVTGVVVEEFENLDDAIQRSTKAHDEHTERMNAVKGALKKFGGIIKSVGKEFLRLGEQEARFAQQTATADAGFIEGVMKMGISQIEYMKILKDTRVQNLAMNSAGLDFEGSLAASKESLEGLTSSYGEAAVVAGKFHQNMSNIGVSQANLGDAVAQQTLLYEKNYRALGYTAEQFADLSAELINDQGMRSTLLSLQEDERKQYVLGIQQRMAEYQTMGYTIERAKELNQTFQALNKMNPKERMKQAAKQRAMMGAMGMGAEGAELFNLQTRIRTMKGQEKLDAQKRITEINQQAASKFGDMSGSGVGLGQSMAMQQMAESTGMTEVFEKFETDSAEGRKIDNLLLDVTNEIPEILKGILGAMDTFGAAKGSATSYLGVAAAVGIAGIVLKKMGGGMLSGLTKKMFKGGTAGKLVDKLTNPGKLFGAAKNTATKAAGVGAVGAMGANAGPQMAEGAAKAGAKNTGKIVGKAGIKSMIKKIPGIGLLAGLGFAAGRLMDGDIVGAGMEVTSGALSTIPGLGTAASFGVDAALVARDMGMTPEEVKTNNISAEEDASPVYNSTEEQENKVMNVQQLLEQLNETMENLNAFLQRNGEISTSQANAMHKVAKNMNDQQRMFALPGARTAG